MRSNEHFVLRHVWWVGLLLVNFFSCLYLSAAPMAAMIPGMIFLVLMNAYTIFTIKSNWSTHVRYRNVSSESHACLKWLWVASIVSVGVPHLYLSKDMPGAGLIYLPLSLVALHRFFIKLALAWDDEEPPFDERDKKISDDSAEIRYSALTALCLATPYLLSMGTGASGPIERTQGWFFAYFLACIFVSLLIGQTYAVSVYALEFFRTREAREDA